MWSKWAMNQSGAEGGAVTAPRARKKGSKRSAPEPSRPAVPPDLRPSRQLSLSGSGLLLPGLPALGLLAWSLVPRIADHESLALQVRCTAVLLLVCQALLFARAARAKESLRVEVIVRRPHWLQMLTQSGVYVYWGLYWDPVRHYVPLILSQFLFIYSLDALLSFWRKRPWVLGFAHAPIILSTNLFMWFKDDWFALQFVMIALGVLSKEVLRWQRNGALRHIFNPSSIALAVVSAVLLLTGTTGITHGYDIALAQDQPPHIHLALFLLGLVVQLNFPVVLVTMSTAISLALLGAAYTAVTGVYMFTTTSIPGAVMLGSLLLVTDPATSPESRIGKVMFGASYGALVFALFPLLEHFGPYGFFDKLLPVPLLNLMLPRFELWAARIEPRVTAAWERVRRGSLAWVTAPRSGNFVHVGIWACAFALLYSTRAVGSQHEGRTVDFWVRACEAKREGACQRLYTMYDNACERGVPEACFNIGAVVEEGKARGTRRQADEYFTAACDAGMPASCARLGDLYRRGRGGAPDPTRAAALYQKACDAGDGASCHNLAHAYEAGDGVPRDLSAAKAFYEKACSRGAVQGCSSLAALEMSQGGSGANKARAAEAFSKACDGGDATGCANLGMMLALGDGVPPDLARAVGLQQKACDGGVAVACARLGDMVGAGQGTAADPARAAELQRKACQGGFAPACGRR
jgi:TPR repeat protein